MHTKDILADELRKAGLPEMADKAAQGYYHDFLSPIETPELQLLQDLRAAGTPAAHALAERHQNGEFDASTEESDDWAKSEDGKAAFTQLVGSRARKADRLGQIAVTEKYWRALKPNAQAFDEVRITTVPRFKQSELSGSEWRISAKIELLRKGVVIVEEGYRDIETAAKYLPSVIDRACNDVALAGVDGFAVDFCDQEGCKEEATVTYLKKHGYCQAGHKSELTHPTIRRFCERHKVRGDCGLDDADANYTRISEPVE